MDKLFGWVNNHFESFDVFIMDNASQYTLMALGYPEDEAIKKTKKQDRNLYNKVTSCLMNTGFREDSVQKKIALLSQVSAKDRFQMLYSRYLTEFKNNPSFQKDCLNASEDILSGKMDVVTHDALLIASQYLLLELPIWFNIPEVFNIPSSVLIYKDFSSPWRHLCCNHGFVSPNQKILIKNIEVD